MKTDKEVKKWFKHIASAEPEKYYPVKFLKAQGFERKKCTQTGMYFWTLDKERTVCGEPEVSGGFTFIGDSPAREAIDYLDVWPRFRDFFAKRGYTALDRRPVVARWRDDVYWVGASVYPFQPYVVRGETKPPARAVTIPQLSLRFNDIDNVGITGSHYTCFDMLGQLHFEKKDDYDIETYFEEYFTWITSDEGMGVPATELQIHEDSWAGGGTFGPCMEFFCRGMEIGNQVYMQFYLNDDEELCELDIKVLDMGQGHERVPWFTSGTSTSYDTTFPTVMEYLYAQTNIEKNEELMQKFLPFAALLNADEVDDLDAQWIMIAGNIGVTVEELRAAIEPLAALYSIAEHMRSALVGLTDGALPSNVGGGYNMRVIIRRAFSFIEKYNWDIDVNRIVTLHASFLEPLYPELQESLPTVLKILTSEQEKFLVSRQKAKSIIASALTKEVTTDVLVNLYDSHGITPEEVVAQSAEGIDVPSDFYALVTARHEAREQKTATRKKQLFPVSGDTEILYFEDYNFREFDATVTFCGTTPEGHGFVVLNKTAFYPTSGGQVHDTGVLHNVRVLDVVKQGTTIIHIVEDVSSFSEGQRVHGIVDEDRRKQLSQHHTGAHIINAASRSVLGEHINQAGAAKDVHKARLDVTHYENIDDATLGQIEAAANAIIDRRLPVGSTILPREDAEERHGMRIYQGGFIPGRNLRLVNVGDVDTQACGGTHVKHTGELGRLKVLSSSRVQDGVIRIHFTAGAAAQEHDAHDEDLVLAACKLLGCEAEQLPSFAIATFTVWKKSKKLAKKGKLTAHDLEIVTDGALWQGDVLAETARVLKTQPEHIVKTLSRFVADIEQLRQSLKF